MDFTYKKILPEDVYISVLEEPNALRRDNMLPSSDGAKGFRPTPNDFMNIFITLIHLRGNCSSAFMARCMGVGKLELQYTIHALCGICLQEWIQRYLLLMANDLVRHTDLPMNKVADRLGFGSQEGFNRFYKRMTKRTPLEVRTGAGYQR